jgi:hypothetical protein
VLISVWIEASQPLSGTAAIEGGEPLRFEGWLELLKVVSELLDAAPPGGGDADRAERRHESADDGGDAVYPESPAHGQAKPDGAP